MKKISKLLLGCSSVLLMPGVVNAAGTYYTGNYQSPQTRYAQSAYAQRARTNGAYAQRGMSAYSRNQYANAGYSTGRSGQQNNMAKGVQNQSAAAATRTSRQGLYLGAGVSRQVAMWQFEMKQSDSVLHYDNIDWNVLDVNAGYIFNVGNTPMQINAEFKYGMQAGESTMVDDDVTNGGYFVTEFVDKNENIIGNQIGHALSIGTSTDGNMMEFNAGVGLTDFMKWGNLKITPSIGWRYLKYELETTKNNGLSIDTFDGDGGCFSVTGDEVQCDPLLIFEDSAGNRYLATRDDVNLDGNININDAIQVPGGYDVVDVAGTFYYYQPGVSHSYEVEWSGPYFALDMLYDINQYNRVNAYLELGLPSYLATGDQPYRFDWAHPKSVEDKSGIGSAFHLGMGANWSTAITDAVALSVGVTYDYYTVSDADAKTYLNEDYYMGIYNDILDDWIANGGTEESMLNPDGGNAVAINIAELATDCPGWVCAADGEIESFYKSLGVRVGINAKF